MIERAFVDTTVVELPDGDLNLEALRPWFAAKRYVELTAAVLDRPGRGLVAAVPSVAVTSEELTLQQKFQGGVGTNLALDLFVPAEVAEGSGCGSSAWPGPSTSKGTDVWTCSGIRWTMSCTCWRSTHSAASPRPRSSTRSGSPTESPLPPWAVLERIVEAGLDRSARRARPDRAARAG